MTEIECGFEKVDIISYFCKTVNIISGLHFIALEKRIHIVLKCIGYVFYLGNAGIYLGIYLIG